MTITSFFQEKETKFSSIHLHSCTGLFHTFKTPLHTINKAKRLARIPAQLATLFAATYVWCVVAL